MQEVMVRPDWSLGSVGVGTDKVIYLRSDTHSPNDLFQHFYFWSADSFLSLYVILRAAIVKRRCEIPTSIPLAMPGVRAQAPSEHKQLNLISSHHVT